MSSNQVYSTYPKQAFSLKEIKAISFSLFLLFLTPTALFAQKKNTLRSQECQCHLPMQFVDDANWHLIPHLLGWHGEFYIFELSYNLTSDDFWPLNVPFDLINKWLSPCCMYAPTLVEIHQSMWEVHEEQALTHSCPFRNKMDLNQLPCSRYIQPHRFIPSQRGNLVKIHLVASLPSWHCLDTHNLTSDIKGTSELPLWRMWTDFDICIDSLAVIFMKWHV